MDIKNNDEWFGHLQISGIAGAKSFKGSYVSLMREITMAVAASTPRIVGVGKEITIRITSYPLGGDKVGQTANEKASEVLLGLESQGIAQFDWQPPAALPDESPDEYRERLIEEGHSDSDIRDAITALFDIIDPDLIRWHSDPKIQRLIRANANGDFYQSMMRNEYGILKAYALANFPSALTDSINWREI